MSAWSVSRRRAFRPAFARQRKIAVTATPNWRALEWLTEVDGTKIGRWPVAEAPFKLSRTPAHVGGLINRGAACYAEDNEYVLGELLGHSTSDIRGLEAEGVI